jgi:hypothetical protein
MMYQQSIEFFWPLTEQIPLELDYTQSDKPKDPYPLSTISTNGTTGISMYAYPNPQSWTTSINVDTNNITITSKNIPPLYRRVLFKLLGINWKQS